MSFCLQIFINNLLVSNRVSFLICLLKFALPLSSADDNFTTEEHDESGKEVLKPNPADIPEGKNVQNLSDVCIMYRYSMIFWYYWLNFIFSVAIIVHIAQGSYNLDM